MNDGVFFECIVSGVTFINISFVNTIQVSHATSRLSIHLMVCRPQHCRISAKYGSSTRETSRWPRDKNHNHSYKSRSLSFHSRRLSVRKSRVRHVHRQRSASWSEPDLLISWSKRHDRDSRLDLEVEETDSDRLISRIGIMIYRRLRRLRD